MARRHTEYTPMKTNSTALVWCHSNCICIKFSRKGLCLIKNGCLLSESTTLLKAVNSVIMFKMDDGIKIINKVLKPHPKE